MPCDTSVSNSRQGKLFVLHSLQAYGELVVVDFVIVVIVVFVVVMVVVVVVVVMLSS